MARLTERLDEATQALTTLEEVPRLGLSPTVERDTAIMRFIYTFEAAWKALQRYLGEVEGIDAGTPKSCLRAARDAGLLDDAQAAASLIMVNDRNLAVHVYRELLAREIASHIPQHARLLRALLEAMARRVENLPEA